MTGIIDYARRSNPLIMRLRVLLSSALLLAAATACRSAEAGVSPHDRERFV
jgi:hypothetical protein